jgi:putative transposase
MQQGFFYDFSNYGTYDRLTEDGITEWHPAFLTLGSTLEDCAEEYRKLCKKYKPKPKPEKKNHWGSKLLGEMKVKSKSKKTSPGQQSLWDDWEASSDEIHEVAEKFIQANRPPTTNTGNSSSPKMNLDTEKDDPGAR